MGHTSKLLAYLSILKRKKQKALELRAPADQSIKIVFVQHHKRNQGKLEQLPEFLKSSLFT